MKKTSPAKGDKDNRSFRQKLKEDRKTQVCCGLFILCIIIIIVTAILLAIFLPPLIAQDAIDKSEMKLNGLTMYPTPPDDGPAAAQSPNSTSNTPSGQLSILTRLSGQISNAGMFDATIKSTRVGILMGDVEFGYLMLPDLVTEGGKGSFDFNASLIITSMEKFNSFGKAVMTKAKFDITMTTSDLNVEAKLGPVSMTVKGLKLKKTISSAGLNGLNNLTINSFDLSSSTNTSVRAVADVVLTNPSPIGISPAGVLKLHIYTKERKLLGIFSTGKSVSLNANGQTRLSLSGIVKPNETSTTEEVMNNFLSGNVMHIIAVTTGDSTNIPLLKESLAGLEISSSFKSAAKSLVKDMKMLKMDLTAEGETSVGFGASTEVVIDSPLGPDCPITVHRMSLNANLLYNGLKVGELIVPEREIRQKSSTVLQLELKNEMKIDSTPFGTFAAAFLNDKLVNLTIQGKANAVVSTAPLSHLGNMKLFNLTLEQVISLRGIGGFNQLNVVKFSVPRDTRDGVAIEIDAELSNPSIASVSLGNVDILLNFDNSYIGYVNATKMSLVRGKNVLQLKGAIVKATNQDTLNKLGRLFSEYITGQTIRTTGQGVPRGDNPAWVQTLVKSIKLDVPVQGLKNFKVVTAIGLDTVDIKLSAQNPNQPNLTLNGKAAYRNPFGLTLRPISQAIQSQILFQNRAVGVIDVQMSPIATSSATEMSLNLATSLKLSQPTDPMAAFLNAVYSQNQVQMAMEGKASIIAATNIGNVALQGIPISDISTGISGMQNLNNRVFIEKMMITAGTPSHLTVSTNLLIKNPSNAAAEMGTVVLNIMDKNDKFLFEGTIKNFILRRGDNKLTLKGSLTKGTNDASQTALINDFVNGKDTVLKSVFHPTRGSAIPYVLSALKSAVLTPTLKGMTEKMILELGLTEIQVGLIKSFAFANVTLFNPLDVSIHLVNLNAPTFISGTKTLMSTLTVAFNPTVTIPPRGRHTIGPHELAINSLIATATSTSLLAGRLVVDVRAATIDVVIGGGYRTTITYTQDKINIKLLRLKLGLANPLKGLGLGGLRRG